VIPKRNPPQTFADVCARNVTKKLVLEVNLKSLRRSQLWFQLESPNKAQDCTQPKCRKYKSLLLNPQATKIAKSTPRIIVEEEAQCLPIYLLVFLFHKSQANPQELPIKSGGKTIPTHKHKHTNTQKKLAQPA
jgi:hypothetical protein